MEECPSMVIRFLCCRSLWSGNYHELNVELLCYAFRGYKVHSTRLVLMPVVGSLLETEPADTHDM
jgi:hypothetical protein